MNYKVDFPFFEKNKDLIYFDNAATTHMPKIVIENINKFIVSDYSNIHRGIYEKSLISTNLYENTRLKLKNFINAKSTNEIVFTYGATDSLNFLVNGLKDILDEKDEIILSKFEHHANLVPWINLAKKKRVNIKYFDFDFKNFDIDYNTISNIVSKKTKIVSISACSNVTGTVVNLEKLIKIVREINSKLIIIVDATALVGKRKIDVQKLDIDFLVFSAHKMYGPTGVGILYGKGEKLKILKPFRFGGDMIDEVYFNDFSITKIPERFEAGTPNIQGITAFAHTIDYIEKIGIENIKKHDEELIEYFLKKVKKFKKIKIYGIDDIEKKEKRVGIFSFTYDGIHPHDIGDILSKENIAIRVGHHCAMPLHNEVFNISSTARISFGIYNTKQEIDKFIDLLEKIEQIYKSGEYLLL